MDRHVGIRALIFKCTYTSYLQLLVFFILKLRDISVNDLQFYPDGIKLQIIYVAVFFTVHNAFLQRPFSNSERRSLCWHLMPTYNTTDLLCMLSRQTDRQLNMQIDMKWDRQTENLTVRHTDSEIDRQAKTFRFSRQFKFNTQIDRQLFLQTDIQLEIQLGRQQIDRQIDRQVDTKIENSKTKR
jgi:hypothetical protein